MRSPEIVGAAAGPPPLFVVVGPESKRRAWLSVKLELSKCRTGRTVTFSADRRYNANLVARKDRGHGLDDPDSRRNLHRHGNQRLFAARILTPRI
jgi:hypothetical protein